MRHHNALKARVIEIFCASGFGEFGTVKPIAIHRKYQPARHIRRGWFRFGSKCMGRQSCAHYNGTRVPDEIASIHFLSRHFVD
jgi:hypothetical protein